MAEDRVAEPTGTSKATVAELVDLIDRTKKALSEVGELVLAERCHVIVLANGEVRMAFDERTPGNPHHPLTDKVLSLDPVFMKGADRG